MNWTDAGKKVAIKMNRLKPNHEAEARKVCNAVKGKIELKVTGHYADREAYLDFVEKCPPWIVKEIFDELDATRAELRAARHALGCMGAPGMMEPSVISREAITQIDAFLKEIGA